MTRRLLALSGALICSVALIGCGAPVAEEPPSRQGAHSVVQHASLVNGDGTQASSAGVTLTWTAEKLTRDEKGDITFQIRGKDGKPITNFIPNHDELLHLFLISLNCDYLHLHPTLGPDGTWTAKDVSLPAGGAWAAVAEFTVEDPTAVSESPHGEFQLGLMFQAEGPFEVEGNWTPTTVDEVNGYTVQLEGPPPVAGEPAPVSVTISGPDGQPVQVEEHMASGGHYVAFATTPDDTKTHSGGRHFVHVHHERSGLPAPGEPLEFTPVFTIAKYYRVIVQFKARGVLHNAEFFTYAYPSRGDADAGNRPPTGDGT